MSAYLQLGRWVEEELVSQEGRTGSEYDLVPPERLVVGDDGDITEMLTSPQSIHVPQGRVSVTR